MRRLIAGISTGGLLLAAAAPVAALDIGLGGIGAEVGLSIGGDGIGVSAGLGLGGSNHGAGNTSSGGVSAGASLGIGGSDNSGSGTGVGVSVGVGGTGTGGTGTGGTGTGGTGGTGAGPGAFGLASPDNPAGTGPKAGSAVFVGKLLISSDQQVLGVVDGIEGMSNDLIRLRVTLNPALNLTAPMAIVEIRPRMVQSDSVRLTMTRRNFVSRVMG